MANIGRHGYGKNKSSHALCNVIMFIHLMYLNNVFAYPSNIKNKEFIEDKLCELKAFDNSNSDKRASLILQMTVNKYASGVVYALDFELINNTNRNLAFRIPSAITEAFMTIITLDEKWRKNKEGQQQILENLRKYGRNEQAQISQNLKIYVIDGREKQQYVEFIIKAGDKKKWLLKMKDVLQTNEMVKKALVNESEALLMMAFIFRYFVDADGCDKEYKLGQMGFTQNERFSLESYLLPNYLKPNK